MIGRKQVVLSGVLTALALLAAYAWLQAFSVSPAVFTAVFSAFDGTWLSLIFLFLVAHVALSALRWATIEGALQGPRHRFELGFASGAIAMALGTVLPAPLMSVLCRSLATKIAGAGGRRGALSGLLDQLCDLAICLWFAIPAVIAIIVEDVPGFPLFALIAAVLGLAFVLLLSWLASSLTRHRFPALYEWLASLCRPRNMVVIYLTSVMRAGNLVVLALLISLTSEPIDLVALAVAVPIVAVTNALAMFPGAFGVSEWGFSLVLAHVGVAQNAIISFLLANRVILTGLPMLLGLIVVACFGLRRWWLRFRARQIAI